LDDCLDVKKRFVSFCKENKITQVKLANIVGMTQQGVQGWFDLKEKTMPNFAALRFLIISYGLDVEWLIIGEDKSQTGNISQLVGNKNRNVSQMAMLGDDKDCTNCSIVKGLMEQNKKLIDKL
jgi:hypothetical protein